MLTAIVKDALQVAGYDYMTSNSKAFLAPQYIQKDYQGIQFLERYHFMARRARLD
jgi:hypothetical protein